MPGCHATLHPVEACEAPWCCSAHGPLLHVVQPRMEVPLLRARMLSSNQRSFPNLSNEAMLPRSGQLGSGLRVLFNDCLEGSIGSSYLSSVFVHARRLPRSPRLSLPHKGRFLGLPHSQLRSGSPSFGRPPGWYFCNTSARFRSCTWQTLSHLLLAFLAGLSLSLPSTLFLFLSSHEPKDCLKHPSALHCNDPNVCSET